MTSIVHDILDGPLPGEFDGAYSLDVMEHIEPENEHRFVGNIAAALSPHAVCVIGMPSLHSQVFASEASKIGHVNCMQAPELFEVLHEHLHHVFIFSMNDEVVHTGFSDMAHYFLALCAEPRRPAATAPSVRLIRNDTNLGPLRAMNRGAREARGDCLTFLSADDVTMPGFFEGSMACLERFPQAGLCVSDMTSMRPNAFERQRHGVGCAAPTRYLELRPNEIYQMLWGSGEI